MRDVSCLFGIFCFNHLIDHDQPVLDEVGVEGTTSGKACVRVELAIGHAVFACAPQRRSIQYLLSTLIRVEACQSVDLQILGRKASLAM